MSSSWERRTDYSEPLSGMSPGMGGSKEGALRPGPVSYRGFTTKGGAACSCGQGADASLPHPSSARSQLALRSLAQSHTHSSTLQMLTENWLVPGLEDQSHLPVP